jgi:hypothetical protein
MVWLHATVEKSGAQVVHITPPVFDESTGRHPGYAAVLDCYAGWLLSQRTNGWRVVDLHTPMNKVLLLRRQADPGFAFAEDGVHPNASGHWIMARSILIGLGATDVDSATSADAMMAGIPHGTEILRLVSQRQDVMKNAWLSAIGHKRPMKPGLPLPEAQAQSAEIRHRLESLLLQSP